MGKKKGSENGRKETITLNPSQVTHSKVTLDILQGITGKYYNTVSHGLPGPPLKLRNKTSMRLVPVFPSYVPFTIL